MIVRLNYPLTNLLKCVMLVISAETDCSLN